MGFRKGDKKVVSFLLSGGLVDSTSYELFLGFNASKIILIFPF